MKITVPESLLKKVLAQQAATLSKNGLRRRYFIRILEIFQNSSVTENPQLLLAINIF